MAFAHETDFASFREPVWPDQVRYGEAPVAAFSLALPIDWIPRPVRQGSARSGQTGSLALAKSVPFAHFFNYSLHHLMTRPAGTARIYLDCEPTTIGHQPGGVA